MASEAHSSEPGEVTRMLNAIGEGDSQAAEDLLPVVYEELRRLAASRMAKLPPGQTLQPTALVHEAYLRLIGKADCTWRGRGHFLCAAARAMRDILVEQARRKSRHKHGGDRQRVELDDAALLDPDFDLPAQDMLELDKALQRLEADHPRVAEIVMLRYFTGLTNEQAGLGLGISSRTVERDWRFARAWLRHELPSALNEPPRTMLTEDD